jgi:hypothetical protein
MNDRRMGHESHKATHPESDAVVERDRGADAAPDDPLEDSHKPLKQIPANEGGKGSLPGVDR